MTELATKDHELALVEGGRLPTLTEVAAALEELIASGNAEPINEARLRATAVELYERQALRAQRANHCARLRLMTEAAIGVLSFDDERVIEKQTTRQHWRALAAAFERGQLLKLCETENAGDLLTTRVAWAARAEGWASVARHALGLETGPPSVAWTHARRIAREKAIDFASLPCDAAQVQARREAARKASERMQRTYAARERLDRAKRREAITRAAAKRGAKTSIAYGLLRRTLQAFHEAQAEAPDSDRRAIGYVIDHLYDAEDLVGEVLRGR